MSKLKYPSKKSKNQAIGKLSDITPILLSLGITDKKIIFKEIAPKRLANKIALYNLKSKDLTKLMPRGPVRATPGSPDIPPPPPPSPEKRKRQSTRKNKETQIKSVDIIRISKEGRR